MKDPHDIIKKPVLTERSYDGLSEKKYVFEVQMNANKTEVKQAIEQIFGVKVKKVNTLITMGKLKRVRKAQGRTSDVKKAYVTLKDDSKPIEFFEGMAN